MTKRALALLILLAAPAAAQLSGPLLLNESGAIMPARPYIQIAATGMVCIATTVAGKPTNQCTVAVGAGGTLQTAYDNSAGAIPSIQLAAGKGPVDIKGPAAALGTLLRVRTTGGTDMLNVTDNGVSAMVSQGVLTLDSGTATNIGGSTATAIAVGRSGITTTVTGGLTQLTGAVSLTGNAASSFTTSAGALTLTAAAASTWSTSAGALTLTGAAASTWSTSAGNLTITGGAALNLNTTGANNMTIKSAQTANVAGAVTFNTDNLYTNGQPVVFRTGGNRYFSFITNGADTFLQGFNSSTDASTSSIDLATNIVLGFGAGGSLNPTTDNISDMGTSVLRWQDVFMYNADLRSGILYGTNAGANITVTATAAAAATAGVTWTHTGGAGGAGSGGVAGGLGGLISETAGTGGAAAGTDAGGTGGAWSGTAGTGGASSAGAAAGAGGAATIAGGAAGGGVGVGNNGGAVNITGGAATGSGNKNGGNIVLTVGAKANSGTQGVAVLSAQNAGAGANTSQAIPSVHNSGTVNQAIEYGTVVFVAGTSGTATFSPAFNATPQCTCTDQTNITTLKCSASSTTLTITTTGSNSDTFGYVCIGDR